jgi:hypothetical protein
MIDKNVTKPSMGTAIPNVKKIHILPTKVCEEVVALLAAP